MNVTLLENAVLFCAMAFRRRKASSIRAGIILILYCSCLKAFFVCGELLRIDAMSVLDAVSNYSLFSKGVNCKLLCFFVMLCSFLPGV